VNSPEHRKPIRAFVARSLSGWGAVGRILGGIIVIALSAGILGIAIVYPLWYLSTNHTVLFTWLVLGLVVLLLVWLFVRRIIRSRPTSTSAARVVARILGVAATVGAIYGASLLGAAGAFWAAIPIMLVVLTLVGYGIGARARSR